MKTLRYLAVSLLILIALWATSGAFAYEAVEVKDGGTISGKVKFTGAPPAPEEIKTTKDQKVCGDTKTLEKLVVSKDGGIKNAVVYITKIDKGKKLETVAENHSIDQKSCEFQPHVLITPVETEVKIINSDGILHNIHTYTFDNAPINKAMPGTVKEMTTMFELPEQPIKVRCDAHEWMGAWVFAVEHPYYAKTDENGAFNLTDVPPGTYTLEVWHETLGKQTKDVTVEAGKTAEVTFELAPKK